MNDNKPSFTKNTILTVVFTVLVSAMTLYIIAPLLGLVFNTESNDFITIAYIVGLTATVIACTLIILDKINNINK